jgi:hypothetical protein
MDPEQVKPGRGDQRAEFLDELQGIQEQMRSAISARMGQLVGELSIGALGESVQGQRGPQEVATEVLELLTGSGVEGHIGAQRESLQTRAAPGPSPFWRRTPAGSSPSVLLNYWDSTDQSSIPYVR